MSEPQSVELRSGGPQNCAAAAAAAAHRSNSVASPRRAPSWRSAYSIGVVPYASFAVASAPASRSATHTARCASCAAYDSGVLRLRPHGASTSAPAASSASTHARWPTAAAAASADSPDDDAASADAPAESSLFSRSSRPTGGARDDGRLAADRERRRVGRRRERRDEGG